MHVTFTDKRSTKLRNEAVHIEGFRGKKEEQRMVQLFYNLKIKKIEGIIEYNLKKLS